MSDLPLFRNPEASLPERVQDLISRLSLKEKVGLLKNEAAGIPRLDIPAYNQWSEGLHGVAGQGNATVFPQAIGMAATWSPELIHRIATAISDEARAKYHAALRRFKTSLMNQGLNLWSPNINIFRDPRWGRGQETYGEDPYLTGELGVAFVQGLQGDDPRYLKTAACAKHYAVHSGPEGTRYSDNVEVTPRDLYDTYLPAFQKLVQIAHVETVMGAYNRVNGEPCCAHTELFRILREDWGFDGHIVSDCGAVSNFHTQHKVTQDGAESAALAIKQGCNLECGQEYSKLPQAVERGLITEADIDNALFYVLGTRFKLGQFDPDERVPYATITEAVIDCPAHRELAYEAATKSLVLLKNNGILPLKEDVRTVFVTGPNAASVDVLYGTYHGFNNEMATLLEGLSRRLPSGIHLGYHLGTTINHPDVNPQSWSVFSSAGADVTIAAMGLSPWLEGEAGAVPLSDAAGDRLQIALPQAQIDYVKKLAASGKPIVLVLFGGSPIALGELADLVDAIIYAWYPGQSGGEAIADLLFGDFAPSGKLPFTIPYTEEHLPPFGDYAMVGRTYRYMKARAQFPFGFGLSYTTFHYDNLALSAASVSAGQPLHLSINVTNAGDRAAEEVVQVYLRDLEASTIVPRYKLVAFQRVALDAGETQSLNFTVEADQMRFIDDNGQAQLEPGVFRVWVGGSSPDPRALELGASALVSADFSVK
ncbi:MAG TPA: glycoside hydrolase family 3 C-terminal domain-containing protein [Phototrophicaceae bacterium]|nr:glycoside hydrolase family 3 C-terminal domain-containing protein [Phototrophicaceae bacterium]